MNVEPSFNVQFILYATLAGVIGAIGMTLVLNFFGKAGWTRANLVSLLGRLLTGSGGKQAHAVGILVHCLAGIIFAMIYTTVFVLFGLERPGMIILTGLVGGFIHGVFGSLIFVVFAVLSEPEGDLRKVQFSGGPAYLLSHVVYGILVGIVLALSPLLTSP